MDTAVPTTLTLKTTQFHTPLGPMVGVADEQALYLLEFLERKALKEELARLQKNLKAEVTPGETPITKNIQQELAAYFSGENFLFKTPIKLLGTSFQRKVWQALQTIPAGDTRSYAELAAMIGRPKAYRAVARANATNQLALIVPCHRVVNADGGLGGYAAGVERKSWLLGLEAS